VPAISRFYGIVISMYSETGGRHHLPHFHARYQGYEAVYAIEELLCLEGELPTAQHRLVQEWGALHREELEVNWEILQRGGKAAKIPPLA
jgi:hypothetical protein